MISPFPLRLGLIRHAAFAAFVLMPCAAQAQFTQSYDQPEAQPAPTPSASPSTEDHSVADNMKALAHSPHDVNALIKAGQSALQVGDATAAMSFFGRANQTAPNDARVKAGLGSTLLLMERPEDALKYFNQAAALGASEISLAVDRGLAYDLTGNPTRAQHDYRLAMRGVQSDELLRRFALSLGIVGRLDEALDVLGPLIRRQDQASWRDQSFILAMNGREAEAKDIIQRMMPQSADTMSVFLTRLKGFNAIQRARAVTFGTMPEDVRPSTPIPYEIETPTPQTNGAPPPLNTTPVPNNSSALKPRPLITAKPLPAKIVAPKAQPLPPHPAPALSHLFDDSNTRATPTQNADDSTQQKAQQLEQEAAERRKAEATAKAKAKAKERAEAAKEKAEEARAKAAEESAKRAQLRKNPSRLWVQVAGGSNRNGFLHTWNALKDDNPELFKARHAYVTPVNHTFRILVGPFKSSEEAHKFVNRLHNASISGFEFTSTAGQEVEKLEE